MRSSFSWNRLDPRRTDFGCVGCNCVVSYRIDIAIDPELLSDRPKQLVFSTVAGTRGDAFQWEWQGRWLDAESDGNPDHGPLSDRDAPFHVGGHVACR